MPTIQKLCPECDAPLREMVIEIPGEPERYDCVACGLQWSEHQVKRRTHFTTWSGGGEDIVTQDQFDAMLKVALRKQQRFYNTFTATPTIQRSSGVTNTTNRGVTKSEVTTPGANKHVEFCLFGINDDNPFEVRTGDFASLRSSFRCFVGPYLRTNPTATQFFGIQMGTHAAAPPFLASPTCAVAQLRIVGSTDHVQLLTAVGDGTPAEVQDFNLGTILPHGVVMELVNDPAAQKIYAYIDGTLLATSNTYPDFGAALSEGTYCALFMTSGTDVAAAPTCWFSGAEITLYDYAT